MDFENCFRKLYPTLCIFAYRCLNDHKQSEDVVQDAFIKLWEKYASFDQFYKVKAFLYITVRNSAFNLMQHARVADKYGMLMFGESDHLDADLESAIIDSETNRLLYQAIETLPHQTKRVIILSLEEKSIREIAEELQISVETVKTLKKRAYKNLREKLADNYILIILFISLFL